MKQRPVLLAMACLVVACAVSGPSTTTGAKPRTVSQQPTSQVHQRQVTPSATNLALGSDEAKRELNGIGFDPNFDGPPYDDPNEPQPPDTVSDKQFEDAVDGLSEAKARQQKRTELIVATEKSHPVRRVQTDGVFGYMGCNGMGVQECESGLILDNGIGYSWHSVEGDYETMVFDVPKELGHKLANIVNGADMLGRRSPAKPCPRDVGSQYLFLARHNTSSGLLAQCAQPGRQELTNSGFYTLASTFNQLLDSVQSGKLPGRRIDFDTMTQGIRDYLGKLPAGDLRKVQVNSWLDTVTGAM